MFVFSALSSDKSDMTVNQKCAAIQIEHTFLADLECIEIKAGSDQPFEEDDVDLMMSNTLCK